MERLGVYFFAALFGLLTGRGIGEKIGLTTIGSFTGIVVAVIIVHIAMNLFESTIDLVLDKVLSIMLATKTGYCIYFAIVVIFLFVSLR